MLPLMRKCMATLIKLLEILTLNFSSENVLIDRREAKMIPKFNVDNRDERKILQS